MPKLTIDGMEIEVAPGTSIIQAAEQLGIEIPRFCYHDKLSVPANCRMCLVEVEKSPKPVASCAMPCADGMNVMTGSPLAQKARKGVMEMLLLNHPLDCPICDQGGECDLQDQAMAYGYDRSRYAEEKRAVKDKELGPLVKTVMTRCIQCTRCIRFGEEIAGVNELGLLGRGEHIEIGTYVAQMATSELSGNLIDVCPVGALTSKPYAYTARPWELRKTQSIDVSDAVGSNIRIDTRGGEVMRILPRLNEAVNEEWISDKARFAWDGLKNQRLDQPYVRLNGKLKPASWEEAFAAIAANIQGKKPAAVIGDLADCESIVAIKDLMHALGGSTECRQDGAQFDVSEPAGYLFNSGIAGIEKADAILLVGTNPRIEAALVNARIRKNWLANRTKIGLIGAPVDLNYPVKHLGNGAETLAEIAEGKGSFAEVLSKAQNPMIILGAGLFRRPDGMAIQALARKVADKFNMVKEGPEGKWNGFNVLHLAASRVGALALGCTADGIDAALKAEVVYLLGADEIEVKNIGIGSFVIYQGHHGDRAAARADVILPGCAYTEKNGTYVNTEGRVQRALQAVFPPGGNGVTGAREDWKIIRALSEVIGKKLPYDTLAQVRERLTAVNPVFGEIDTALPAPWKNFGKAGTPHKDPFMKVVANFYMTDAITRASKVMADCTDAFIRGTYQEAAHG